jgi:NAD(P)-dependent dehydrogenase (short-subunit alcohol dehydrogenase family)
MDHNQKVFVVTGANAGLGLETSRQIVDAGHQVLVLCRTKEKCDIAIEDILKTNPEASIEGFPCDMGLMEEIRGTSTQILDKYSQIHGIVNNVGTWSSKYTETKEGFETVFATNHLSYVLLTHLLYPALRKVDDARVVNVSSNAHSYGKINLDDPGYKKRYHGLRSNGQSKLANVYFTEEFHKRTPDKHISTYAISPGLVKTDLGFKFTNWFHAFAWTVRRRTGQTPAEGARTQVFCALDPSVANQSGLFWEKCKPKETFPSAKDDGLRVRLWDYSNELLGIEDYFHEKVSV